MRAMPRAAWLLMIVALAAPVRADEPVDHGSGHGRGDSRGPGKGDGLGRGERGKRVEAPAAPKPKERPPLAFDVGDDLTILPSLQHRLRYYHHDGHDFREGGEGDLVRQRARLGLGAVYRSLVGIALELQDVRTLGEEIEPLRDASADGFDLHQGYVFVTPVEGLELRLGRHELAFANERLLGSEDFREAARSFDALSLRYAPPRLSLDAAYALVRDYGAGPAVLGLSEGKRHLGAVHAGYELFGAFEPHVIAVVIGDTATDTTYVTAGALVEGHVGGGAVLGYQAEGYYQGGKDQGVSLSAWLAAAELRFMVELASRPFVEGFASLRSGDEDPGGTDHGWRAPYGSAHPFHGEIGFFTNLPQDLRALGLRDFGARAGFAPAKVDLTAAFHWFDPFFAPSDELGHFGYELDFKAAYHLWQSRAWADAVYAFMVPGDLARRGVVDPRVEHFAYITMGVKL
jgi:hypothetical protein